MQVPHLYYYIPFSDLPSFQTMLDEYTAAHPPTLSPTHPLTYSHTHLPRMLLQLNCLLYLDPGPFTGSA